MQCSIRIWLDKLDKNYHLDSKILDSFASLAAATTRAACTHSLRKATRGRLRKAKRGIDLSCLNVSQLLRTRTIYLHTPSLRSDNYTYRYSAANACKQRQQWLPATWMKTFTVDNTKNDRFYQIYQARFRWSMYNYTQM